MVDMFNNEATVLPEENEEEIWKPCPGWEGRYEVSSFGRVKNIRTDYILMPHLDKNGYYTIQLYKQVAPDEKYKRHTKTIHRLVCAAFWGEPEGEVDICDHVDKCRINNYYKNLRWVDYFGNRRNRSKRPNRIIVYRDTTPIVLKKDGVVVQRYPSIMAASKELGLSDIQIYANVIGQRIGFAVGTFTTEEPLTPEQHDLTK